MVAWIVADGMDSGWRHGYCLAARIVADSMTWCKDQPHQNERSKSKIVVAAAAAVAVG